MKGGGCRGDSSVEAEGGREECRVAGMTQEKFGSTEEDGGADGKVTGQVGMAQRGAEWAAEGAGWCRGRRCREVKQESGAAGDSSGNFAALFEVRSMADVIPTSGPPPPSLLLPITSSPSMAPSSSLLLSCVTCVLAPLRLPIPTTDPYVPPACPCLSLL